MPIAHGNWGGKQPPFGTSVCNPLVVIAGQGDACAATENSLALPEILEGSLGVHGQHGNPGALPYAGGKKLFAIFK